MHIFGTLVAISRYESGLRYTLVAIKPLLVGPRINSIDVDLYRARDVSPGLSYPEF